MLVTLSWSPGRQVFVPGTAEVLARHPVGEDPVPGDALALQGQMLALRVLVGAGYTEGQGPAGDLHCRPRAAGALVRGPERAGKHPATPGRRHRRCTAAGHSPGTGTKAPASQFFRNVRTVEDRKNLRCQSRGTVRHGTVNIPLPCRIHKKV